MKEQSAIRRSAKSLLATKAKKRLVASIASVKITPEIEAKAKILVAMSRKAKTASFLDKYRIAPSAE